MYSGVGMITMAKTKQPTYMRSAYQRLKALQRRHKRIRIGKIVSFALLTIGIAATSVALYSTKDAAMNGGPHIPSAQIIPPLAFDNSVEEQAVTELRAFGAWLRENNATGFVGEIGWPDRDAESAAWNKVAEQWYKEASYHDLWVTAWAAGSWWGDYLLAVYVHAEGERNLDTGRAQAQVLDKFRSQDGQLRGINLAGMEFGTEGNFSNANPGIPGQQYFYEPTESMVFLASRGIDLVRLPVRWERLQPVLGGELRASEVQAIKNILDAASANNIKIVLDLHNYGVYKSQGGELQLGTTLSHDQLVDVWKHLSATFKDHPALAAYGLMNEPHDLLAGTYGTPAKNWEVASQRVVDTLRQSGDKTLIMVAGYDWSSLERWAQNHPKGWITDPSNNFRYEAHHYWDKDGSGTYKLPFQQEF